MSTTLRRTDAKAFFGEAPTAGAVSARDVLLMPSYGFVDACVRALVHTRSCCKDLGDLLARSILTPRSLSPAANAELRAMRECVAY